MNVYCPLRLIFWHYFWLCVFTGGRLMKGIVKISSANLCRVVHRFKALITLRLKLSGINVSKKKMAAGQSFKILVFKRLVYWCFKKQIIKNFLFLATSKCMRIQLFKLIELNWKWRFKQTTKLLGEKSKLQLQENTLLPW